MKSYGTASRGSSGTVGTLATLLDLRRAGEKEAERALGAAAAVRRTAEAEEARLARDAEAARAAVAAARHDGDNVGATVERAGDAQARRRFWARLEAQAEAATAALVRHRKQELARAIDGDTSARAAHLRARQRREVVEKALARREAIARREADRREEAIQDDRYVLGRASTKTPTTGK